LQETVNNIRHGLLDEFDSIAKKVESVRKKILSDD